MKRIWGIDFSAAQFPASHIWIAEASWVEKKLRVHRVSALTEIGKLPPRTPRRKCLAQLVNLLVHHNPLCVGFDFPFGLPLSLAAFENFDDMLNKLRVLFPRPEALFDRCYKEHTYPVRFTDRVARAPFSPCNLRVYRQTYWGICDILLPLRKAPGVRILPFQPFSFSAINVVEICPASLLRYYGKTVPYKGSTFRHRAGRETIVRWVESNKGVYLLPHVKRTVLEQQGGDALDAVLALIPLHRLLLRYHYIPPPAYSISQKEGWIYVV